MADNVLETLNDAIDCVSRYLGPGVCAKNGIPEILPATEVEAARALIKLYEVLKVNIQNMELELKGLRGTASFDVQIAVAKEIRQREKMLYGKIDVLIEELRKQGKI
jgi:sulfur relay (sulfurtransferase) DsrF/TusC family protein